MLKTNSIRQIQKQNLKTLFNKLENNWKILILDDTTFPIISPLFTVQELRESNIATIYMLESKRTAVKTNAFYFISKDLSFVLDDMRQDLYLTYNIFSLDSLRRQELERFALESAKTKRASQVHSVFDSFQNFVCLQDNLFTSNIENSFRKISAANFAENFTKKVGENFSERIDENFTKKTGENFTKKTAEKTGEKIANSLFSVLFQIGENTPKIIYNEKSAAAMEVAQCLSGRLNSRRELLKSKKSLLKRPLLILFDRLDDVLTPIKHVWTYSGLIKDLLPFDDNRVTLPNGKRQSLAADDEFWQKQQNEFFPAVAQKIDEEYRLYKKDMARHSLHRDSTQEEIRQVLEKAPELARRSESVNAHMEICLSLVDAIKERGIDDYYRTESSPYSEGAIADLETKGTPLDAARLACCVYAAASREEAGRILAGRGLSEEIMQKLGKYNIKREEASGTFYNKVVTGVLGKIENLLPRNVELPISKFVENCLENKHYIYNNQIIIKDEISRIIVYSIGGGTYIESKSLRELQERIGVPIVYGSTEVLSAESFMQQL